MPLLDKCVPAQGPFHAQMRDSVLLLTLSFDSRKRLPEVERVALLALPEMPEGLYDATRPKVDEARVAHHEKAKELRKPCVASGAGTRAHPESGDESGATERGESLLPSGVARRDLVYHRAPV